MIRYRSDPIRRVGIATTKIAARAHQHVDDGFEFLVIVIVDGTCKPCATQNADIGGRNVVEMLLIPGRRKELGLVQDAKELRNFADEVEEGAEALDLLPGRLRGAGPRPDELHHIDADLGQQLVEQFLAIFEMVVKGALRHAGLFGDAGNGGFRIAVFADDFGCGVEYLLFRPRIALDPVEFRHLGGCGFRRLRHALASSSARSTRLSTLPDGFRGRLSRMMNFFGTLKPASLLRQ